MADQITLKQLAEWERECALPRAHECPAYIALPAALAEIRRLQGELSQIHSMAEADLDDDGIFTRKSWLPQIEANARVALPPDWKGNPDG